LRERASGDLDPDYLLCTQIDGRARYANERHPCPEAERHSRIARANHQAAFAPA
jgi:hypothetical protein